MYLYPKRKERFLLLKYGKPFWVGNNLRVINEMAQLNERFLNMEKLSALTNNKCLGLTLWLNHMCRCAWYKKGFYFLFGL